MAFGPPSRALRARLRWRTMPTGFAAGPSLRRGKPTAALADGSCVRRVRADCSPRCFGAQCEGVRALERVGLRMSSSALLDVDRELLNLRPTISDPQDVAAEAESPSGRGLRPAGCRSPASQSRSPPRRTQGTY